MKDRKVEEKAGAIIAIALAVLLTSICLALSYKVIVWGFSI